MYLVQLPADHPVRWLFLHDDPRRAGCPFPVETPIDYEDEAYLGVVKSGADPTLIVLGRSKTNPYRYRRFIGDKRLIESEYEELEGAAIELSSWTVYQKVVSRPHSAELRRSASLAVPFRASASGNAAEVSTT